jgi:phosphoribosylamine--glycine ligase
MDVLVVGGGGREHALVWKIRQSPRVARLFCAPGNAGIGELAELVPIAADDVAGLKRFAAEARIALTVVGPERPLALGIADEFEAAGLRIFGPRRAAAEIEASKVFAKELCRRCHVPTAAFGVFSDPDAAERYVRDHGGPLVVKADGLAAGKGVFVCGSPEEACRAIDDLMRRRVFGAAGGRVVVEERLEGEELSFMALADGETVLPLDAAQDHKRALDGDAGPNTGGMGAYSPVPLVTPALHARIMGEIMVPVVRRLRAEGIIYRGVLYAGLMVQGERPWVLEFNVRFGDPECQPLMLRLKGDLVELMERAVDGRLAGAAAEWDPRAAVCVVLAAGGYPGEYEMGKPIEGLDRLRAWSDGVVFHAGTARAGDRVVTSGGRVLGVTGLGADLGGAIAETYRAVAGIRWDGMHYRSDIGRRVLRAAAGRDQ